jgi:hypothetical protein
MQCLVSFVVIFVRYSCSLEWNASFVVVGEQSIDSVCRIRARQDMAVRQSKGCRSLSLSLFGVVLKRGFSHEQARGSPVTSIEFFLMGAVAKLVATVITYPIQLAQSRLRAMKVSNKKEKFCLLFYVDWGWRQAKGGSHASKDGDVKYEYSGTMDVLIKVVKNDGPLGVFRGMEAKIYQTVATAALMFATYERIQALVFAALLRNQNK